MLILGTGSYNLTFSGTMTITAAAAAAGGPVAVTWNSLTGMTLAGTTLTKTGSSGAFNAAARSTTQGFTGDVKFVWTTLNGTSGYVCGLTSDLTGVDYTDVEYGINQGGSLNIFEAGASRGAFGAIATGNTLEVRRVGNTITYYKNSVLFYTSLVSASGKTLYPMISSYNAGDEISGATLEG